MGKKPFLTLAVEPSSCAALNLLLFFFLKFNKGKMIVCLEGFSCLENVKLQFIVCERGRVLKEERSACV